MKELAQAAITFGRAKADLEAAKERHDANPCADTLDQLNAATAVLSDAESQLMFLQRQHDSG